MAATTSHRIKLTVTTPERLALEREVDFVALPAVNGELGVLPGHIPYVAQLGAGVLKFRDGEASDFFAISGGFAEIKRDRVEIFAESAELSGEIDAERARMELEKAKGESRRRDLDPMTLFQAEAAARRAAVRLRVAELRRAGVKKA